MTTTFAASAAFVAVVLCLGHWLITASLKTTALNTAATAIISALKSAAAVLKSAAATLESVAVAVESAMCRAAAAAAAADSDLTSHATHVDADACERGCDVEIVVIPTFTSALVTAPMTTTKTTPLLATQTLAVSIDISSVCADAASTVERANSDADTASTTSSDCVRDADADGDALDWRCCQCECTSCVFDDACGVCLRRDCCVAEELRLGIQEVDDCSDFSDCAADLHDLDDDEEYYGFDCSFFDKPAESELECTSVFVSANAADSECELKSTSTFVFSGDHAGATQPEVDGVSDYDSGDESELDDDDDDDDDEDEDFDIVLARIDEALSDLRAIRHEDDDTGVQRASR